MAGLESIALAVDFLEQRESKKETETQPRLIPHPTTSAGSTTAPIPPRTGFVGAPRRVSSDTVNEENGVATPPPPPPTYTPPNVPTMPAIPSPPREPSVAESMSPELIARMVENLADDGEFKGPPPPPPPPTEIITRVMDCDVLCGRGGETNHHSGNVKYRSLVKRYQPLYIMSKRRDKPLIASKIVRLVRHMGGRFLRKDKNNSWRDVGNTKAREKTSQALREGAPDLRSPQKNGSNKEEQTAAAPAPRPASSPPLSSLGVRKQHPDFHRQGGYNAGMGLYAPGGPPIVEGHPGEMERPYSSSQPPAAKKMRVPIPPPPPQPSMSHMHAAQTLPPQFWGGPQHAFLHGMPAAPPAHFMNVSSPTLTLGHTTPSPPLVSPHSHSPSFAAVSADDDDSTGNKSSSEERETSSPKPRGPRLKLLKKRLQEEQSGN